MTQPSRTTETINRDNAAIRGIMHQVRELTVPDRATLALGLVGHLATMMNRSQMTKLMSQLQEEAERVQDVPPNRQRDGDPAEEEHAAAPARAAAGAGEAARRDGTLGELRDREPGSGSERGRPHGVQRDDRMASERGRLHDVQRGDRVAADRGVVTGAAPRTKPHGDPLGAQVEADERESHQGVGQAGRGEFRSRRLL